MESLSFNGHKRGQTLRVDEGQERLVCCSPWGCKELDMTERLHNNNGGDADLISGSGRSSGEGNGNPFHYYYLGNPINRGAWQLTVSLQSLSYVRLFATPWTVACQASLSITNSRSFLKLMSVKSMMPSNHLILCRPLLLLPLIFPSIRVFSSELALHIR